MINEESADTKAGILEDPLMLGLIGGGALIVLISIVIIVRFFREMTMIGMTIGRMMMKMRTWRIH